MSNDKQNLMGPHVSAQVAAAWAAFEKASRDVHLRNALQNHELAFSAAMDEMQKVWDFVGSPETILGNPATKHGEIAEQVHVGVLRALDALYGRDPSATFDGVHRTGPVDYIVNGIDIQSKYCGGLRNTLDRVLISVQKNPEFTGIYNIPSDQYAQLEQLRSVGTIDGFSEKTVQVLQRKLEEIQKITGDLETGDPIQPGVASYSEVQQVNIQNTLNSYEQRIAEQDEKLRKATKIDHNPSIQGFGKAMKMGAAAGGGVRIGQALWVKWREGKNPFRGEFSVADWKEVGVEGIKGGGEGAITGGTLYLITNATKLAAPFAGALVSGLLGVGNLLQKYHEGMINGDQFIELSMLVASDAAIVGVATVAGQTAIPVPVLGALIGSLSGQLVASALKASLGDSEQELSSRLVAYEAAINQQLDKDDRALAVRFDEYFSNMEQLIIISFDETVNTSLRLEASVRFAEFVGVPKEQIIRSTDDLDQFMKD